MGGDTIKYSTFNTDAFRVSKVYKKRYHQLRAVLKENLDSDSDSRIDSNTSDSLFRFYDFFGKRIRIQVLEPFQKVFRFVKIQILEQILESGILNLNQGTNTQALLLLLLLLLFFHTELYLFRFFFLVKTSNVGLPRHPRCQRYLRHLVLRHLSKHYSQAAVEGDPGRTKAGKEGETWLQQLQFSISRQFSFN